jgi:hypothetical protein
MANKTKNPVLDTLLRRMAKQERKHYAFYYQTAAKRLTGSWIGQRLAKAAIGNFWRPVGSGVGHVDNMRHAAASLFGAREDWQALVEGEAIIRELPGMGWFYELTKQTRAAIDGYQGAGWQAPVERAVERQSA